MKKVSVEFLDAFFSWLPGTFAGFVPLASFLMVNGFGFSIEPKPYLLERYSDGLNSHLLVIAMVASTVSVTSAFSRVGSGSYPNFARDGRGPVLILLVTFAISALSFTLYTIQEMHDPGGWMRLKAVVIVIASLVASLSMEVAMARLRLLEKQPERS